MSLTTVTLLILLSANDGVLMRAEKMLDAKDCDGLVGLFESQKPSKTDKDISYARTLVRAAQLCRPDDKVIGMALTEKALLFAPKDYGVQTAHAESMLALDQRSEAAKLLDDTIADHPEGAVRARFLRGQLADEENEPAIAVQVLKPIADDSEYGPKAAPLIARNEEKLLKQSTEKAELKTEEDKLKAQAEKANQVAAEPLPNTGMDASGREVWSARGTVKSGGSRSFSMKGVKANQSYVLYLSGNCTQKAPPKTRGYGRKHHVHFAKEADTFAVDFQAKVGGLDAFRIKAGIPSERNSFPFRPLEDNPQLIVEDKGSAVKDVTCTVSDISVRAP